MNKTKKACVVGGSNGIGLSVARILIERGYYVFICDMSAPDEQELCGDDSWTFIECNLLDFYAEPFRNLARTEELDVLMITAGFGRCAHFESLNLGEISNILSVNAVSAIKIIRLFYGRIKNRKPFFCGVMGSIAGLINSPLFSAYAASKAAICRFIESVNTELSADGFANRITNVSPGSIKGTKFNGGKNNFELTKALAEQIVSELFASAELFIPDYESVYKDVIRRNTENGRQFGLDSYKYKMKSGRVTDSSNGITGYLFGTFDLFHIGHLNLLKRAKSMCDYLIVGVHPDASHKGKQAFIPFDERKKIVRAVRYVDEVIDAPAEDSDAWDTVRFNRLFVGGDYKGSERFERYELYFKDKGVKIVYFPYTKGVSSTQIREELQKDETERDLEKKGN